VSDASSEHRALIALIVIAALYLAAALTLGGPLRGYESDEAVYVSQVSDRAPPAPFEAHRARGIVWLVAPIAAITSAVLPLRVFMAVVVAVALVLAFRPWLRVLHPPAVPVAAVLFSATWISVFYASEVSPNLLVAFAGIAACGHAAVASRQRGWSALAGVGIWLAVIALLRPTDSLWIGAAVGVAALVTGRRVATITAVGAGLVAGWVPWVVEAVTAFGGPLQRLQTAAELSQSSLRWTLPLHLRVLDGNLTCCFGPDRAPVIPLGSYLWFSGLVVLVAAGVVVAQRGAERRAVLLALGAGLAIAVPYLLLTGYVIVRFLLPVHGLLSIPAGVAVAALLRWAMDRASPELGGAALVAVALAYGTFLAWQADLLIRITAEQAQGRGGALDAAHVARSIGVAPPCYALGARSPAIAFELGCSTGGVGREAHLRSVVAVAEHRAAGETVAVFWRGALPADSFARDWQRVPVAGRQSGWAVYVPPDFRLPPGQAMGAASSTR
jgi:hypothetical protein